MARYALLLASSVALAFVSCSHEEPLQVHAAHVDSSGGVTIETAGVRIEVEPAVRYLSTALTTSEGSASSATLDGHAFGLRDGDFFIGPSLFGPAPAGALVRVTREGVFVDAERRGDLPAATSPSGE